MSVNLPGGRATRRPACRRRSQALIIFWGAYPRPNLLTGMTGRIIFKLLTVACTILFALLRPWCLAADMKSGPIDTRSLESDQTASEILRITNQILQKQTELERYYLQYRIQGGKEPKWRRLRYFVAQQMGALGFLSSNVIDTAEFGNSLKDPRRENEQYLRYGYTAGLVGSIIGGGSDGLEIASNALTAVKNKKRGVDPGSVKKTVIKSLHDIDGLTARRSQLIEKLPPGQAPEVLLLEGQLLKEYRDLSAYEFADVYSNVKSYQASYNVFYVLDMISEIMACTSWGLSIEGVRKDNLNGPAILAGLIADSIAFPSAPTSSFASSLLYKYWHAKFAKELGEKLDDTKKQTISTLALLKEKVAAANAESLMVLGPINARLYAYSVWSTRYESFLEKEEKRLGRLDLVARQYNSVGPAIALGNLGQDVLDTVGFYKYGHRDVVATRLYFAGSISTACSSFGSFTFTNYRLFDDYLFEHHLRRSGEMPEQLVQTRLNTLDELENKLELKTSKTN